MGRQPYHQLKHSTLIVFFVASFLVSTMSLEVSNVKVDCVLLKNSTFGQPISCSSTKPYPLKFQTTIKLKTQYYFSANQSLSVFLRDSNGKLTYLNKCTNSTPSPKTFKKDENITVSFQCEQNQLPRPVQSTDSVMIYMFVNETPDSLWLTYLIPIQGSKSQINQQKESYNNKGEKLRKNLKKIKIQ